MFVFIAVVKIKCEVEKIEAFDVVEGECNFSN